MDEIPILRERREMMRRLVFAGLVCPLVMLFAGVPSAGAAQSVGGCQLQGTANFSPALNSNAQNFSYSFSGGLTAASTPARERTTRAGDAGFSWHSMSI